MDKTYISELGYMCESGCLTGICNVEGHDVEHDEFNCPSYI